MGPGPSIAPTRDPRPALAPPSGPGPRRRLRRRWPIAVAVAVALLGTTVAVATTRHDSPAGRPTPPVATGPQPAAQAPAPAASDAMGAPDGVAGLGTNPSLRPTKASPSAAPSDGFRPFPAPRTTLPGASIHLLSGETFAEGLARSDRTYGPLRMVRVFYPGLPPAWSGSRADVANRTVVVSFKAPPADVVAGKYDARLANWFASIPRDHDVYWSYFHEPENDVEAGNYTAAQFRAAWRRVAGLADRARNPQLRATLILMCWTLNPNSRRSFADYYPGGDVVDVLGWDCYNSGGRYNRYTDPAKVFGPMITKSKALGKPWGLAETGSVRIDGDSGTGRAAWLRSVSSYLNSQRPLWVAYYDYQVSGGDFRLTDTPSQDAWRAWCAAPS